MTDETDRHIQGEVSMKDYATPYRRRWLSRMQYDLFGSLNAYGIDREELAFYLSDRLALLIAGVIVYGVLEAAL